MRRRLVCTSCAGLLALATIPSARADFAINTANLVAYYDFEETGTAGLANKAPGATQYNATRYGGGTFNNTGNPSGPGFSGNASFNGGDGLSDRSVLLSGNALNLVDLRADAIVVPLGTSELGQTFTISGWHKLTPGASNTSTRYHVFESSDSGVYDVSWGTANSAAGPLASYSYLGYLASGSSVTAAGVSTYAWHHVVHVFTVSGANTTLTVYLDGVSKGTLSAATSSMSFTALHFGRARVGTDGPPDRDWDGMLDEISIWSRALSAEEVTALYNHGQAGLALSARDRKADNTTAMNLAGSWLAGVQPDSAEAVLFDSTYAQAGALDTGAALDYAGLQVTTGSELINIDNAAANYIRLGALGLDMSAATRDLAIQSLRIAANQAWNVAADRVLTVGAASQLSGSYTLAKSGAGTVTLLSTNSYTGATTISAGTLEIGGAGQLGSGTYSSLIANDGTLVCGSAAQQTFGGVISGTGALTKAGAGTLTLTAKNTYSGNTTVNGGVLVVNGPGSVGGNSNLGSSHIYIEKNARLTLAGSNVNLGSANTATLHITGGTLDMANGKYEYVKNVTLDSGAAWTLGTGNPGYSSIANFSLSTVTASAASTNTSTIGSAGGKLSAASGITFAVARGAFAGASDLTVSAVMVDYNTTTGRITKTGSGILTLSGANTYSGTTMVSGGTLVVASGGNLGGSTGAAVTVGDGATLWLQTPASGGMHTGASLQIAAGGAVTLDSPVRQTVKELYIGGVRKWAGTWGGSGSSAPNKDSHFSGAGTLVVTEGDANPYALLSTANLIAYYDFEQAGTVGLANKAPGATQYDATIYGGGTFDSSANPSGPGFQGNASFDGGDGLSDRSRLLSGNALNLVDLRGDAIVVPLGTSELGQTFTISVWQDLTPGAANASTRFFVFESSTNSDVSWGTSSGDTYVAYVGGTSAGSKVLSRNGWHHTVHVFTVSGANTAIDYYVDGVWVGSGSAPTASVDFSAIFFGRQRSVAADDRDWDGMLDEVGIWSRALSSDEVATLYQMGLAGIPATANGFAKSDNLDSLEQGSSWLAGLVPGSLDVPLFGSAYAQAGTLGAAGPITCAGLQVTTGAGLVNIGNTSANYIQLGAMGLDMSAATRDLTVESLRIATNQIWNVAAGRTFTVGEGSTLSGACSLTKTGGGTVSLRSTNDYTGATVISAGTLEIAGAGQLGGGTYPAAIANNGTLVCGSAAQQTFGGIVSGTGVVTKAGSGTLTLGAINTYTGATTVNGGTLVIASTGKLGGGADVAVTVGDGATLWLQTTGSGGLHTGTSLRIAATGTVTLAATVQQTVKELYIGGVRMWKGTWGSGSGTAPNKSGRLSGTGTLVVTEGDPNPYALLSTDDLMIYYDFQETGTAGLANKAPLATQYNATRYGGGAFDPSANPSGPGFAGKADFNPGDGVSDRSALVAGKALNLVDTRNDALVIPVTNTVVGTNFTISLWQALTPSGTGDGRPFVFEGTNNYHLSWGIGSGDTYSAYVTQSASIGGNTLSRGPWHHVVQTFSSSGGTTTLRLYVDGQLAGTANGTTANLVFTNLYLGRAREGQTRRWDGMFDEIGFWKRTLSADEVTTLYRMGLSGMSTLGYTAVKDNNLDLLSQGSSWQTGAAPGAPDLPLFNSAYARAGALDTANPVSYAGLQVTTGSSLIDIANSTPANYIQLGIFGLDMSAASRDLTIQNLRIATNQTWNIASGHAFTAGSASVLSGNYTLLKAGEGTATINANGAFSRVTVTGGGLAGSGTLTASDASIGFVVTNDAGVVTVSANLANASTGHSLRKEGAGTAVVSGANTYTGGTILNGGTLSVSNIADAGSSHIGVVSSSSSRLSLVGGALEYTGTGAQSTARYLWADTAAPAAIGVTSPTGSLTLSPAGGTRTAPLTKTGAGTLTLNGAWGGSATMTVAGGTLVLGGVNTYAGATTIDAGTLELSGAGQLGSGTYSALVTNNGALVCGSSAQQTFSGVVSGAGAIVKAGSGTLTLSNAGNSFGGGTTVSNGVLVLTGSGTDNGSHPAGTGGIAVMPGASLLYNGYALGYGESNDLTLSGATATQGNGVYDYVHTVALGGGSTWTLGTGANPHGQVMGNIWAPSVTTTGAGNSIGSGGGALPGGTFDVGGAGGATGLTVSITLLDYNGGQGSVTKAGAGIMALTGANTYSGGTTVSGGTLVVSGAGKLGSGTNVTVTAGTLDLQTTGSSAMSVGAVLCIADGAQANLGSAVAQQVKELYLGGKRMWKGTWGASAATASYTDGHFSGSGYVIVSEGAPHPATSIQFR